MSFPVVSPLSPDANDETMKLAAFYNETLGFCPNGVFTMQHRPAILTAAINLNKAVMENHGRVTNVLKRLIAYVASSKAGCQYCQAHTILAAERFGADSEQLAHICQYSTHAAFSPAERAALDFAVAASSVPNAVNSPIIENLRQHWDEGEIVEILGVISHFGFLNRWHDSMGTTIESGALNAAEKHLAKHGWSPGKHAQTNNSS
ncbi:unnamed protein product [Rotaria socialis]|uniref:Carboxymuconolactone decarboxylase-like domain-containing protein n=1 Tax=Rotaria socialis TaxID=392032 RepID=A0A821SFE8_9BILA|nr:unnamed protein product [Rotaria socialis]CAF3359803.1 unnamed protein product [Rotaria socialis]CAF3495097.1 unnamed protein product [Rotaria socialis]CAF3708943.1 unnamed protein product [Rotaria socialis]CAF4389808.1 unnamed protein product [Rotaria socialis]